MKVLLVAVDTKEVNIALGKLSTYHKAKGDVVVYKNLGLNAYPNNRREVVDCEGYDLVYVSQLFEINTGRYSLVNYQKPPIFGGIGLNNRKLPNDVEFLEIDYSLFDTDTSFGFITRGCIRNCYFCKVPAHEGKIYKYSTIDQIVRHDKVKFMDNNILAFSGHLKIFEELIEKNIKCQFNQGMDIRLINDKNAELISKLRHMGNYIFAFDNIEDERIICEKVKILKKYISKDWSMKFYVYHNSDFTTLANTVYRVEWLRKRKILPYLMRDKNCWDSKYKNFLIDFAAYCNQPGIFKKMNFHQFMYKRHTNKERIYKTLSEYKEATQ